MLERLHVKFLTRKVEYISHTLSSTTRLLLDLKKEINTPYSQRAIELFTLKKAYLNYQGFRITPHLKLEALNVERYYKALLIAQVAKILSESLLVNKSMSFFKSKEDTLGALMHSLPFLEECHSKSLDYLESQASFNVFVNMLFGFFKRFCRV